MDKVTPAILNDYTSIKKVQAYGGKLRWRLRWKNLKKLGKRNDPEMGKAHYRSTRSALERYARETIAVALHEGKLAENLEIGERTQIIRKAVEWKEKGIDPVKAMEAGGTRLLAEGLTGDRTLGVFWKEYSERKIADGKWGSRHARSQQSFYEAVEDTLMQEPVSVFLDVSEGAEVIRRALTAYHSSERNSLNTLRAAKSKIGTFLYFVASKVRGIERGTIKEIFLYEALTPAGLRPEADNVAITAEQAKYLIGRLAKEQLAGWIVLKLFIGARTLLLQNWRWSIIDWENHLIHIPKAQTKLKKDAVKFVYTEIPNLKEWLLWAWRIDGEPKKNEFIAPISQPAITNLVKRAINENKDLFGSTDKRRKIQPAKSMRNFMRSGFITYGIEEQRIGVGKVMKIAEDHYNFHKYLAQGSATGTEPEAEKFWNLAPEDIELSAVKPLRKKRHPRGQRKK